MTKEQREQAEAWSKHLEWLYEGKLEAEIAALLRAGIAASEECERLQELLVECRDFLRRKKECAGPEHYSFPLLEKAEKLRGED